MQRVVSLRSANRLLLTLSTRRRGMSTYTLNQLMGKPNVRLTGAVSDKLAKLCSDKLSQAISSDNASSVVVLVDAPDPVVQADDGYDLRVLVGQDMNDEEVSDLVVARIEQEQRFVSTRTSVEEQRKIDPIFFFDTVRQGLAPDGGLYFPAEIPSFTLAQLERLVPLSFEERALRILEQFPLGTLSPQELKAMLKQAYSTFTDPSDPLPVTHLEDNQYLLEEYHGPTASFKDLALQLTPQLFRASVKSSGHDKSDFLLLAATSGDTGSAALHGFGKIPNVPVVVLFPKGGVSPIQQAQMVSCPGDVCVISVESDFDFCQALVKHIFTSNELRKEFMEEYGVDLTSGNSMNWGRLFPQIPYTFTAYLELVKMGKLEMGQPMDLCVPTGNFGNILGGVIAKQMGLPVGDLVVACNENNILADWITSGSLDKRERPLHKTTSPSIDILLPSNLERYLYLMSGRDDAAVAKWFKQFSTEGFFTLPEDLHSKITASLKADWGSGKEAAEAVKGVFSRSKILLDPHTAVGKVVADKVGAGSAKPMVIASTAHYGKFPTAALEALGITDPDPHTLSLPQLIDSLDAIDTKTAQHPEITKIKTTKVIHEITAPGDVDGVLAHIRGFLASRKA